MPIERSTVMLGLVLGLGIACGREQEEPLGNESGDETSQPPVGTSDDGEGTTVSTMEPDSSGGDSTGPGEDCEGPEGCYDCAPTTPVQVLDACTDATCSAFPITVERLPLLERDGGLPPIP